MTDETTRANGAADAKTDGAEEADSEPSSAPTIRELDDRTVRQIAAGEVVERPASVVKELVENSLDAGANRISVAVEAGGTEGVRVRDDGVGMDRESVRRAVEEHTTSKIADIDDLEAGVGTLGFRGEALHTISAVSRLTIRTKPRGGDAAGTELRVEGGEVTEVGAAGCPEGTVVEVADLFYNTPARRKFLKTTATEFDHVNTVVTHYALANPDVAISLEHDDREVFATEGRGSLQSAVLSVYGREVAESMIRVGGGDPSEEGAEGDENDPATASVRNVRGLVSHPETTRSTREYLSTFVNGRYVTARTLREAVLDAYGGQLATDRYPFAVLFVDVPADAVDVNVHPRKMEVRFDDEEGVRGAVTEAVRTALLDAGLIRSTAPRGRSAPAETEIEPESPASEARGGAGHGPDPETRRGTASQSEGRVDDGVQSNSEAESAAGGGDDTESGPGGDDTESGPGGDDTERPAGDTEGGDSVGGDGENANLGIDGESDSLGGDEVADLGSENRNRARTVDPDADDAWTVSRGDRERGSVGSGSDAGRSPGGFGSDGETWSDAADSSTGGPPSAERTASSPGTGSASDGPRSSAPADSSSRSGGGGDRPRPTGVLGPTVQRDLHGEAATLEPEFDSLPSMRVLGQLHDTYVVAETDGGMLLIDQHAADERVNYERLRRELDGDVATQALAESVELELTAREAALFDEYREALARLGFRAERAGERTVAVESVPAVFAEALDPELLRDVLTAFVGESDAGGAETVESVADELLADLACYPSVTGNTSLTEGSVVGLLEALDDCENPYACPHGRPVIVSIDAEEIGSRFERDYPGHGGRRDE
ncbi:DNA mismatch repair endonuclease MutL [Halobellus sp. GM3]|uniref:DNA mismatch repair endonuclease MutL n=1 Tax=Halobellus sp. GM3 TaxID=3458410 RepID=UPI00403D9ED6